MDPLYKQYPVHVEDSLRSSKEQLTPVSEGRVGMYVCGPTVYSKCTSR